MNTQINDSLHKLVIQTFKRGMKLVLKVKANYPKDMKMLEAKAAEIMARILVSKLQTDEAEQLIEVLQDKTMDIRW